MQEEAAIIDGKLARASERRNTVLSRLHRQKQKEELAEKLGFAQRPHNPNVVESLETALYFYKELKGLIGNDIAKLRRLTITDSGEVLIRQLNKQVNKLIREKGRYLMRIRELGGKLTPEETKQAEEAGSGNHKIFYFGCAIQLPEAATQREQREGAKRPRENVDGDDAEEDEEDDENYVGEEIVVQDDGVAQDEEAVVEHEDNLQATSPLSASSGSYKALVAALAAHCFGVGNCEALKAQERELREVEAKAEKAVHDAFRRNRDLSERSESNAAGEYITDFYPTGDYTGFSPYFGSDAELEAQLREKRKESALARLRAMREKLN